MTQEKTLWALVPCMAALAIAALTGGATAQVTADQQSAIRSSCRSDFMSKCSGVTPGGKDALACLQKNVASLSPACKTAVSATIPAPAPAQAAPAPAPAPAAAAAAATPPPQLAPASATAAPVQAPAAKPAAKPAIAAAPPPATPKPPRPAKPAAPATAAVAPPTQIAPPPAAAPPPATHAPNAPVVMTAVIGRSCLRDLVRHCRDVGVGDGQKLACLTAHADSLTPLCRAAMNITTPLR